MTKDPRRQKNFDCVEFMRQARDRITAETAEMTADERIAWFNSKRQAAYCRSSNHRGEHRHLA